MEQFLGYMASDCLLRLCQNDIRKIVGSDDRRPSVNRKLSDAIIERAAEDYLYALCGKPYPIYDGWRNQDPKFIVSDCERFFRSQWFQQLTTLDPEYLISKCKRVVAESGYDIRKVRSSMHTKKSV